MPCALTCNAVFMAGGCARSGRILIYPKLFSLHSANELFWAYDVADPGG
jgi:hypothetical protein